MPHTDTNPWTFATCRCDGDCGCEPAEQGCLCSSDAHRTPSPRGARIDTQRRALPRLAGAIALLGLVAACGLQAAEPANLDLATQRPSEHGTYRVSYRSQAMPIPVGRLHSWTVHVETPDGRAVTDAAIGVDGDMPQHGHGLPTRPRVTRNLGQGDYLVEGLKFQMGGWWVMEFSVTEGGATDIAKFNLKLPT